MTPTLGLFLASSNAGKLREYRSLVAGDRVAVELLPEFAQISPFEEAAPTFAENAAGKAEHYSRGNDKVVLADDSGIVVPALGGAPGVHSARYAGPSATDADRVRKLLHATALLEGDERKAKFVCVVAVARRGRVFIVASDSVEGTLAKEPRGSGGFGYDPIFFLPQIGMTYAEASQEEKNRLSHRGKAFRRALALLEDPVSMAWTE
ncbi:MAG TPA: RdgB/HAM1 family non-canonical purine NTP pyrophosphatase [Candidatus Acidoferrum sp.]|nr:RdgB/HAM1 family non-canonical purine NTP pyrophosphatase [Candidatus Acidoferrum sp.]